MNYGNSVVIQNVKFLRKYIRLRNQIQKITRSIHRAEQNEVSRSAKTDLKKFWAVNYEYKYYLSFTDLERVDVV